MRNDIVARSRVVRRIVVLFLMILGVTHYFVFENPSWGPSNLLASLTLKKSPSRSPSPSPSPSAVDLEDAFDFLDNSDNEAVDKLLFEVKQESIQDSAAEMIAENASSIPEMLAITEPEITQEEKIPTVNPEIKQERMPLKTFDPTIASENLDKKTIEVSVHVPEKTIEPSIENTQEISRETRQAFAKAATKITLKDKVAEDFRRAVEHIHKHEFVQAEIILSNNLIRLPSHHASRLELATIYLNKDQLTNAEKEIQEGLKMDENHPEMLKVMAMIFDKKEEPEKALSLLSRVKGRVKEDKSYISFLGYIYQQTGRYALARQQYGRLLQMEPKNPLWLLGVTVALDSEGQKDKALVGYKKLKNSKNVDPNVQKFIQDRIASLNG